MRRFSRKTSHKDLMKHSGPVILVGLSYDPGTKIHICEIESWIS